ncbi:MAG: hypothetical protein ACRC68_14190 [Clostridium sp.]
MKCKLSKAILLTTGIVAISTSLILLSIKSTKTLTPDCSKSSTTYI